MLGVRTRAQGTDAITSYFDNLERPGAGKKSRGWQDSKALKRVPQVSPFLSSKGKSEDSDEEDSLLSLRRLLRFVFSRDRYAKFGRTLGSLAESTLTAPDLKWFEAEWKHLPALALAGGLALALLYSPSLSVSFTAKYGGRALVNFLLALVVLAAKSIPHSPTDGSAPSPSLSLISPSTWWPAARGVFRTEHFLLFFVAVVIQTLSLKYSQDSPSPDLTASTSDTVGQAPFSLRSGLFLAFLELLPAPLADMAEWMRLSAHLTRSNALSQVSDYAKALFQQLAGRGAGEGGAGVPTSSLLIIGTFVFLCCGAYMKHLLGRGGAESKIESRL